MKQEYIEGGKIVGTHGVKGMVRIQSWCDTNEQFCSFKSLYLKAANGFNKIQILSAKPHGNVVIAQINGINSIDEAEAFRNKIIYIKRNDLNLEDDRYLICDLINCSVFDYETGNILGTICDVTKTGANDVWHIKQNNSEYLVPVIEDVVKQVDVDNERIVIKPLDGIFNMVNGDNED